MSQQAATLLPIQQFTQPQTPVMAAPTLPQQQQQHQPHQQQPMQTVQVVIANIELPVQQGQAAVQLVMPSQQQAQQTVMLQSQQQNAFLQQQQQQQQPSQIVQQQHSHIIPQQQQQPTPLMQQQGSFATNEQSQQAQQQQQQSQDALSTQTLSLPVHLRPPDDHTYSQSQPPTIPSSVQQQSLSITQQPFQYQVVQGQPCSAEASSISPVASVSMATQGTASGFSMLPQPTQVISSPLQMVTSFTAEPTADNGKTLQPSQGGWSSEALTPSVGTISVSPTCALNPNPVQTLNLQSALHQIFSIVNMNASSELGSGSVAGDSGSPTASPTKPQPSTSLHLGMTPPSSQPGISVTMDTRSSPATSSVNRELTCNMFLEQEQALSGKVSLTQPDHQVAAGVGELQQNSPDTQESPPGEVTSSPLSSDMMNLLSENCE